MYRISKAVLAVAVLLIVMTAGAFAQAPNTLMYQGKLTDASLDAITDSTEVIFRIWDADIDGIELWAENDTVGPNAQGVFAIELGAEIPFLPGTFDGSVRYLGIEIVGDADGEMTPRQPITAAPYSLSTGRPSGVASAVFSSYAISDAVGAAASITVTVPGPGYVVLHGTGWGSISAGATIGSTFYWVSISSSATTHYSSAQALHYFAAAVAYAYDYMNFAVQRVLYVASAGTYTFYMTTYRDSGTFSCYLNDCMLTATYVPTSIAGGGGSAMTTTPSVENADPGDGLQHLIDLKNDNR